MIYTAITQGALIPVEAAELRDRPSRFSAGGECPQAAAFVLRPSDEMLRDPAVRAALRVVVRQPDERLR